MHSLLLLVIIVLLIILLSKTKSRNYVDLKNSIDRLNDKIMNLTVRIETLKKENEASRDIFPVVEKKEIITTPVIIEKHLVEEVKVADEVLRPEPVSQPVAEKAPESPTINIDPPKITQPQYPAHEVRESWFGRWLRNNPDIEKFIG